MELVLRQTITLRDRFAFVHVLRHTAKEAEERFGSAAYKEHRARVVLGEMASEYACIVLAPAITIMFESQRRWYSLGFTPGKPVGVLTLLCGAALQLFAEFVVDLLCLRVEALEGIPVTQEWDRTADDNLFCDRDRRKKDEKRIRYVGGKRRLIYLWYLSTAVAWTCYLLLVAFMTPPPPACLPYPCHMCMAEGGLEGGEHLNATSGTVAELVHWCKTNFPGAGGNATYFCKDAHDVRIDVTLGGITAAQAAQCTNNTNF